MYEEQSFEEHFDYLNDLLQNFEKMWQGLPHDFLDEDDFVEIIDHFDEDDNISKAIDVANLGIEQFPYNGELQVRKAALLNAVGHFDEALFLLESAGVLNATDTLLYIYKMEAYLGLEDVDAAFQVLKENIDEFSGVERSGFLLDVNELFDEWGALDEGFDSLVMILEEDPENEEALERMCYWTEYTGRIEEGIKLHKDIIDHFPFNVQAWFNLGCAFKEIKLYEKAIDAYEYALAINEHFVDARQNMADAFIRLRKYDKAIEILEDCLELGGPDSSLYEALGYCFERSKRYRKARSCYRMAFSLSPEDDNLYFRIGHTYMLEKSYKQAVPFVATACKINPRKLEYRLALGECFVRLDKPEDAILQFLEAIEVRPGSKRSRLALVGLLYEMGCWEEALEQIDIAEDLTRRSADYHYYRCAVLFALGKDKEGLFQLEVALNEAPNKLKILKKLNPGLLRHKGIIDVIARFEG